MMRRKTTQEEVEGLSSDDLCDYRSTPAYAALEVCTRVALEHRLEPKRRGASVPSPSSEITTGTRSPRTGYPGIFLIRRDMTAEELSKREKAPPPEVIALFHDSERGDIYDLYNACNGEMNGQLLDVRKLEELTAAEREVLDVERLREVWQHTASRCTTCAQIVETLNSTRRVLRDSAKRIADHMQDEGRDTNDE